MKRFFFVGVLLTLGCGENTDFDDPEHVSSWANSASALAVYTLAYEPVAFDDGELTFDDPACPVVEDDGTTLLISGGCTNRDGRRYVGSAAVVRGADGARELTLDGYGSADGGGDPAGSSGTVVIETVGLDEHTFDAQVTRTGGNTWTVSYLGRVRGGYDGATEWSGSGTVSRDGPVAPSGTVTARTVAQLRDPDVCANQAASGSTTIEHGGRTLVIEYDGAVDCDDAHAARYSVDGEDRGLVSGVACSARPGGGSPGALLVALAAMGLLCLRRRGTA